MNKRRFISGFLIFLSFLTVVVSAATTVNNTSALSARELRMYAINNILGFDKDASSRVRRGGYLDDNGNCIYNINLSGETNAAKILQALLDKGYTLTSAAAILGNLHDESGFEPRKFEGGALASENFVAYSNGKKNFSGGFGIVQWTSAGRVANLQNYADKAGLEVTSLETQVGFMLQELESRGYAPESLNRYSLEEATWVIYKYYEAPASSDNYNSFSDLMSSDTRAGYQGRLNAAKAVLSQNGDATAGGYYDASCNYVSGDGDNTSTDPSLKIAQTAIRLAWPYWGGQDGGERGKCDPGTGQLIDFNINSVSSYTQNNCRNNPKPAYEQAIKTFGLGDAKDCGHFVAAVLLTANIDANFKLKSGSSAIRDYLSKSGNWLQVDLSELQPGDVIWNPGHIFIYVGSLGGEFGTVAQASQGTTVGVISRKNLSANTFQAFRFKQ